MKVVGINITAQCNKILSSKHIFQTILCITALLCVSLILSLFFNLEQLSLSLISSIIKNNILRYLGYTIVVIIAVGLIVFVLGGTIAWFTAVYNIPFRKIIVLMQVFPLTIPNYITAISWNEWLIQSQFMEVLYKSGLMNVASFGLLVLVLSCNLYPYVFLILYANFLQIPQSIVDASKNLGRGNKNLFWLVGIPFVRLSLIGALLLVVMETLNAYWVYTYLGFETITTGIIRIWRLYDNLSVAKFFTLFVVLVMMAIVYYERRQERRQHFAPVSHSHRIKPQDISHVYSVLIMIWVLLPILFGFLFPIIRLSTNAISVLGGSGISYRVLPLIGNTFYLCALVLAIQIPLAIILSFAIRISKKLIYQRMAAFVLLGYAIPSSIVAILILSFIHLLDRFFPDRSVFSLYVNASMAALVFACVYRYIPVALTYIGRGFNSNNIRFEQAARSLGSGNLRTLFRICIPINYRYILTALMITTVDLLKDIPMTKFLHPIDFHTLALKLHFLVNDEQIAQASVVALILIFFSIIITSLVYSLLLHRGEHR